MIGIPAEMLADEPLRRELRHLYETRWDALTTAGESAFETHTARMLELEREFQQRFPAAAAPDPMRTRAGRRREGATRRTASVTGGTATAIEQSTTSQSRQRGLLRRFRLRA